MYSRPPAAFGAPLPSNGAKRPARGCSATGAFFCAAPAALTGPADREASPGPGTYMGWAAPPGRSGGADGFIKPVGRVSDRRRIQQDVPHAGLFSVGEQPFVQGQPHLLRAILPVHKELLHDRAAVPPQHQSQRSDPPAVRQRHPELAAAVLIAAPDILEVRLLLSERPIPAS